VISATLSGLQCDCAVVLDAAKGGAFCSGFGAPGRVFWAPFGGFSPGLWVRVGVLFFPLIGCLPLVPGGLASVWSFGFALLPLVRPAGACLLAFAPYVGLIFSGLLGGGIFP